ncbi:type III pantothenate kinase [Mesonia aquimarina]|uniref:type III pantothenate kinase n=1 Tax=Mesonia aquimarina TaxID=1504967 RepID=UPI000EF5A844|nr:type III pantothenate kinase [Mesonia aquimarina]
MNLVIDVGNTLVKLAVFQQDKIVELERFLIEFFSKEILKKIEKYPEIDHIILSSVVEIPENWFKLLQVKGKLVVLSDDTLLPFKNNYASPKTLGKDRLALVAGAKVLFPNKNVLVIDAGSCITYDFLQGNNYEGGAISPGMQMRFKAMHNFTAKLPLITQVKNIPLKLTGKTTEENMIIGVLKGIQLEIDGFIDTYKSQYKDLTVILSGGDSELLSRSLKNGIFAPENFLLRGLNSILEFNKH